MGNRLTGPRSEASHAQELFSIRANTWIEPSGHPAPHVPPGHAAPVMKRRSVFLIAVLHAYGVGGISRMLSEVTAGVRSAAGEKKSGTDHKQRSLPHGVPFH